MQAMLEGKLYYRKSDQRIVIAEALEDGDAVRVLPGQLDDRGRPHPTVKVIMQNDLGLHLSMLDVG